MEMSLTPMVFGNDEFKQLRVIVKSPDEIYFNLHDIAWGLGYVRPDQTGKMYLRKDRIVNIIKSLDIPVLTAMVRETDIDNVSDFEQLYIPESGLYEFVFESKADKARKFRKWVVEEVLPSIRKTGMYIKDTKHLLALAVIEANKIIQEQQEMIQQLQPKAEYYDLLVERNHLTNFRDTAKELRIPERKLTQFLVDRKVLYRDSNGSLRPYAQYMKYFELKDWVNGGRTGVQTLIKPEGKQFILELWRKYHNVVELSFDSVR